MLNRFTDQLEDLCLEFVTYVTHDGIQCCMCSKYSIRTNEVTPLARIPSSAGSVCVCMCVYVCVCVSR